MEKLKLVKFLSVVIKLTFYVHRKIWWHWKLLEVVKVGRTSPCLFEVWFQERLQHVSQLFYGQECKQFENTRWCLRGGVDRRQSHARNCHQPWRLIPDMLNCLVCKFEALPGVVIIGEVEKTVLLRSNVNFGTAWTRIFCLEEKVVNFWNTCWMNCIFRSDEGRSEGNSLSQRGFVDCIWTCRQKSARSYQGGCKWMF